MRYTILNMSPDVKVRVFTFVKKLSHALMLLCPSDQDHEAVYGKNIKL